MKLFLACLALACSIFPVFTGIKWAAADNPENPRLDNARLSVSHPVQGEGGNLGVQVIVQINGTC